MSVVRDARLWAPHPSEERREPAQEVVSDVAHVMSEATRTLHQHRTVAETARSIAEVVRSTMPVFDHVGVSVLQKGSVVTTAHLGDLALRLAELQHGLGEGPGVDALGGCELVTAPGLRDEQRWARYVPQARALGVRAQVALRLRVGEDDTIGSIDLYSTVSDQVSPDARALAGLLAAHAAVALSHAQERAQLTEAITVRQTVGQAVGIVMERYDIDEDHAFAFLARISSHTNTKLRAVAQEVVEGRGRGAVDDVS